MSIAIFKGKCSLLLWKENKTKHGILLPYVLKDTGKRLMNLSRMNIQSKWHNAGGLLVEVMSYQSVAKTI